MTLYLLENDCQEEPRSQRVGLKRGDELEGEYLTDRESSPAARERLELNALTPNPPRNFA